MNIIGWLTDPANWTGSDGIPTQVGYHLLYSAIALLAALAIGVPLGIVIGYTGRGETVVAGFANALRALPSLGLLILLFTPYMRVQLSLIYFYFLSGIWKYSLFTGIVFLVLTYSLLFR